MKLNKKLLTTLATIGTVAGLGAITANADTVTVQSGDTVSEIAQKYNTTVSDIQKQNNLTNPNVIYVGQKLQVNDNNTQSSQVILPTTSTTQTNSVDTNKTTNATSTADNQTKAVATENTPVATQSINTPKVDTNVTQKVESTNDTNANSYVSEKPVQTTSTNQSNTTSSSNNDYSSNVAGSDADAKAWIAQRESGGNYNARNGQYVGKYQLSSSYLNGDYSEANQEKCADNYVAQRYGSWTNAKAHWEANGWY